MNPIKTLEVKCLWRILSQQSTHSRDQFSQRYIRCLEVCDGYDVLCPCYTSPIESGELNERT